MLLNYIYNVYFYDFAPSIKESISQYFFCFFEKKMKSKAKIVSNFINNTNRTKCNRNIPPKILFPLQKMFSILPF